MGTVTGVNGLPVPQASAPIMYGQSAPPDDLLPWSWAEERLVGARNYWVATVREHGPPHCRPIWGAWLDTGFWFSTGGLARHNLAVNDRISVHLEDGMEVVIVEGTAVAVADRAALRLMCDIYTAKYDYPIEPTDEGVADNEGNAGPAFRVIPQVVFGWANEMSSPTRWNFST